MTDIEREKAARRLAELKLHRFCEELVALDGLGRDLGATGLVESFDRNGHRKRMDELLRKARKELKES